MAVGELLGAGTDEVNVLALFEDEARGLDGVAEALDAGYAAGPHSATVHKQGVKLDAAIGGEEAATSGVKSGIVFEDSDGCFDGVKGRAATGKDALASFKGGAHPRFMGGHRVIGDCPGATVNEQGWGVQDRGGHRDMVVQLAEGAPEPNWEILPPPGKLSNGRGRELGLSSCKQRESRHRQSCM